MIHHRLLQRMQRAAFGEILDRDQLRAVELAEQQDAGIYRLVNESAMAQARQHDRAGAAIAFRAAFLRPFRPHLLAQPVENQRARREPVERDLGAAETEAQRMTGLSRISLQGHGCSSIRHIRWSFWERNGRAAKTGDWHRTKPEGRPGYRFGSAL